MMICRKCKKTFEIIPEDRIFYRKIDVPEPTLCPYCRQQRRACFRNEFNLYRRKCDKTGAEIVSMYRPEIKTPVYSAKAWWADNFDPLTYGRNFDFKRSFFEQFQELQKVVPRLTLYGKNNENSDYSNHTENCQNCYMCASTVGRDVYYAKWVMDCTNAVDCYQLTNSSFCYESLYSGSVNNTKFIYLTHNSSDSDFLYNCKDVKHSFMCSHLRHQEYSIENKPYSKEEYALKMKNYDTGSYANLEHYKQQYTVMIQRIPHLCTEIISCEDCTGDYIYQSKNVKDSYGVSESHDARYCYDAGNLKDCYDVYESAFDCELQYECHAANRGKRVISCSVSYDVNQCAYCEMCHNSEELFGCIGVRRKKYCILNKQYSKEEYFMLKTRIIDHMKKTGEWGEFFPQNLSFFAYNESAAMEFAPLTKEEALKQGWNWNENTQEYKPQTYEIPDHIKNIPDSIINEILACIKCKKNYRIMKQELDFYRKQNLPVPRKCFQCRYFERLQWKNLPILFQRNCAECAQKIQTTYAPDRPEKILCEKCYLKIVY